MIRFVALSFSEALLIQVGGAAAGPSQCELQVDAWTRGDVPETGGKAGGKRKPKAGQKPPPEKTGPNRRERRAMARGEVGGMRMT